MVIPSTSRSSSAELSSYRTIVVGGRVNWTVGWADKISDYVSQGGTIVVNAAHAKGLAERLLGVRFTNEFAEADSARCLLPDGAQTDLNGQMFRYERVELAGAKMIVAAPNGDPLVTINKREKGSVIFSALPDLLGQDGRITPFAAHMLAHVFIDATPVTVSGDVEYLLNRTDNSWVVTLLNNNGVFKPQQGLAQVDRTAYVTASISLKGQTVASAVDWITDKPLKITGPSQPTTVNIAPGGVAVIELRSR